MKTKEEIMKVKVFNIDYDTDGEQIDLPQELILEVNSLCELEDKISDETGFCHWSFEYEIIK